MNILAIKRKRKVVVNLNYESIAELVNDLVKKPKSMLSKEKGLSSTGIKANEMVIIQKVFSDSDTLTIGPEGLWA